MDDFLRGRNRKTASQIIAEAKASISTEGKVIIIVDRHIFGYISNEFNFKSNDFNILNCPWVVVFFYYFYLQT